MYDEVLWSVYLISLFTGEMDFERRLEIEYALGRDKVLSWD